MTSITIWLLVLTIGAPSFGLGVLATYIAEAIHISHIVDHYTNRQD